MRKKLLFFIAVITTISLSTFLISGCHHPTQPIDNSKPEYAAFAIDLQNGFQGDTVLVKVDNQILYERATWTTVSNGFAFRLVPAISPGTHQIDVSIPSLAVQTDITLLIVPDVLVVGINFDRSKNQLSLSVDTTWLTYGVSSTPCLDCPWNFRLTDFEPAWSPDGNTIAYVHGDTINGQTGIWLIDANGRNKRILYSNASAYSPAWSPANKWIAFSCNAQIYKIRIDGTGLTQLTSEGRNFFPAWSPDGNWIAYDSNVNDSKGADVIWIMKSDGTKREDISQHGIGEWRMPDWSPDGRLIVYQRYVGTGAPEVFTMDTSGSNAIQLTRDNRFDSYPKYSPNRAKIAFTSEPYASFPQIWTMDSDGTNLKQLTKIQGYSCD
jgi:TolB protein